MKKILVFGVFDGVHEGHRAFLRQARSLGDYLVAAVTRDVVAEQLKGRRPEKDQGLRIKDLIETELVGEAVLGDMDLGSWEVIGKVNPDIVALGYDQTELKARKVFFPYRKGPRTLRNLRTLGPLESSDSSLQ